MTTRLPNILVFSFRPKIARNDGIERLRLLLAPHAKLFVISISDEYQTMPSPADTLRYVDGLFILGSSDLFFDGQRDSLDPAKKQTRAIVESLRPLVNHIIERDLPTFAFCFGHQLIAHCMGSPVAASPEMAKVGTYEVELTEEGQNDPMFASFPKTFWAHYGHRDVVATRPKASTLLAHGKRCHNTMLRYGSKIYTSQFHPELDGQLVQQYLGGHSAYAGDTISRSEIRETPYAESLPVRFIEMLRQGNLPV